MSREIDPHLLARLTASRTSRRRFLGGSAAAAAAIGLGSSVLAACGGSDSNTASSSSQDSGPASGTLRISNWPLYMADGFVAAFQTASGITVDYKEDFNDNEQWFAKVKEPLSRKQDIGADLVVPTSFMAVRLHQLGWLNEISDEGVPNKKNIRPDLLEASVDPGRKFTAPYMSGMVGLAYNRAATGRDIKSIDDLWDPAFKGRVSLFSDAQDGLGMIMLSQGNSPEKPTTESVQKAVDLVAEQNDKGQIRRFTGNDYADDLAAGNIAVAQAYSGDVVQLQADNPDLQFIVPESGGDHVRRHHGDPLHHAEPEGRRGVDQLRLRPRELREARRVRPVRARALGHDRRTGRRSTRAAAKNPLINPSEETLANSKGWAALTDEQTQEYNTAYAAVTGG